MERFLSSVIELEIYFDKHAIANSPDAINNIFSLSKGRPTPNTILYAKYIITENNKQMTFSSYKQNFVWLILMLA